MSVFLKLGGCRWFLELYFSYTLAMYCYVVSFWFNWIFSSSQGSQNSGSSLSLTSTKVCSMDEEEGPVSDGKKSSKTIKTISGWFRQCFHMVLFNILNQLFYFQFSLKFWFNYFMSFCHFIYLFICIYYAKATFIFSFF